MSFSFAHKRWTRADARIIITPASLHTCFAAYIAMRSMHVCAYAQADTRDYSNCVGMPEKARWFRTAAAQKRLIIFNENGERFRGSRVTRACALIIERRLSPRTLTRAITQPIRIYVYRNESKSRGRVSLGFTHSARVDKIRERRLRARARGLSCPARIFT